MASNVQDDITKAHQALDLAIGQLHAVWWESEGKVRNLVLDLNKGKITLNQIDAMRRLSAEAKAAYDAIPTEQIEHVKRAMIEAGEKLARMLEPLKAIGK